VFQDDKHRSPLLREGERLMTICNACRYCEGFCAVFPAMERRLDFSDANLDYLANLCHNCSECYYACQYAPPHEFAVNVPKVLAEIRAESYRQYAWPQWHGAPVLPILVASVFAFLWAGLGSVAGGGDFYAVISHATMVAAFGAASVFVLAMLLVGFARFWHQSGEKMTSFAVLRAFRDALTLKYLDNGGHGCAYPEERHSQARRWFHHLTFYGFLLCFASTSVAAIYHSALGLSAPYAYFSLPVILGTLGGIGLLIGPAGLYSLKQRQDPGVSGAPQDHSVAFLALLFFTSLTGFLLLALRETPAMGALLGVHLGVVLSLFLTMPYGKFVHGIYRFAALVRYALDAASSEPRKAR
jgi:citrate/tricarballylate utilization protein